MIETPNSGEASREHQAVTSHLASDRGDGGMSDNRVRQLGRLRALAVTGPVTPRNSRQGRIETGRMHRALEQIGWKPMLADLWN